MFMKKRCLYTRLAMKLNVERSETCDTSVLLFIYRCLSDNKLVDCNSQLSIQVSEERQTDPRYCYSTGAKTDFNLYILFSAGFLWVCKT